MNWISNVVPPKIRSLLRRDTPENLWVKCPESGELVFHKDLEANLMVVPGSGYHMSISPKARLASLLDDGVYEESPPRNARRSVEIPRHQALLGSFEGKSHKDGSHGRGYGRVRQARGTGRHRRHTGFCVSGRNAGLAAGEAIVAGVSAAIERATPFLIFTTSGGGANAGRHVRFSANGLA